MRIGMCIALAASLFAAPALAGKTHVDGYVKKDGSYVAELKVLAESKAKEIS